MPFVMPCTVCMDWRRMHSTWHIPSQTGSLGVHPQLPMHEQPRWQQLLNTHINASNVGEVEGLIKVDIIDRT